MACLSWLLNLGFAGGSGATTPPDMPGKEFAAPESRMHAAAPESRMHAAAPASRMHFAAPEED